MQGRTPFDRLRARSLLLGPALAVALVIGLIGVTAPTWLEKREWDVALFYLLYTALAVGILVATRRAGLSLSDLIGPLPRSRAEWILVGVAVPLIALSAAGLWLTYVPLSHLAPSFVTEVVLADEPPLFVAGVPVRNVAMAVCVVLIAPVVEELLFRGLLLHRWARKWGRWGGILASSAVFAVVHVEILGGFLFGLVMVMVYVRTQTLWVPIACHVANNALALAGGGISFLLQGEHDYTLEQFRSDWWIGLLGLVIGAPLLWLYVRRYWPRGPWRLPHAEPRPDRPG